MQEVLPWLSPIGVLGALAYTIWSNRTKATSSRVHGVEQRLTERADKLAAKIDALEDRATRIETRMENMPSKDVAHEIQVSVTALSGKVDALTERLKPVAAMAERLQEAMIEKVTSK